MIIGDRARRDGIVFSTSSQVPSRLRRRRYYNDIIIIYCFVNHRASFRPPKRDFTEKPNKHDTSTSDDQFFYTTRPFQEG